MNVLVLGGRVIGPELARELVTAYLGATFTGEERHRRRLQKVYALEGRYNIRAQHVEQGTP
jgi:ribose 5-phosphate isomerase RpiB